MIPRRLAPAFLLALAWLPGGCALWPAPCPPVEPPLVISPPAAEETWVTEFLRAYRDMQPWTDKRIEQERPAAAALLTPGRCDLARLRLAGVYLRGFETGLRQEVPEDLLQTCLNDPTLVGTSVPHLAHLLQAQLREAAIAQARQRAAQADLELAKKQNSELKRQLDGLKAIERSLQDRRLRRSEGSHGSTR